MAELCDHLGDVSWLDSFLKIKYKNDVGYAQKEPLEKWLRKVEHQPSQATVLVFLWAMEEHSALRISRQVSIF